MSATDEIEDRAARWLIHREQPEWSADDQDALDAWLDQSMAHKAAYWRLEHGWRQADRLGAGAVHAIGRAPARWLSRQLWIPIALAASIVIIVGISVGIRGGHQPAAPRGTVMAHFDTPVGGRKTIRLGDGTQVELNTATVLRTTITRQAREVWLDSGEAYFDVRHNDRDPFVVHAGDRTITDLGTRFTVRRDGDKVTVSVLEGRVRVDDGTPVADRRAAIITAGDVAIGLGASTLLAPRSQERVESAMAWRSGTLRFDQTTLGEAAAEFNRYNRKQIVVTDPATAAILIGGTFQAANADAFVRLLHDAYGLRVTDDADVVKISA